MKIAIPAERGNLDAKVNERFGRTDHLLIVDSLDLSFRTIDNAINSDSAQGAGLQTAQAIVDGGAEALVVAHCGPKAFDLLKKAGIEVYIGSGMTAREAVDLCSAGKLPRLSSPDVRGHH